MDRWRVQFIRCLLAVHLLLNLLVCWTIHSKVAYEINVWIGFPLLLLGPSQGGLLGAWIALGGKGTSWRVLLAVGGIVAYLWCVGRFGEVDGIFHLLLAWAAWVVSALLLLARFTGLRIVRGEAPNQQRPQFSLRDAFVWMTAFAVLLGATCWQSSPFEHIANDLADAGFWTAVGSSAAVSLACFWLVLGTHWLGVRILVLPLAIAAGAVALRAGIGFLAVWAFATLLSFEAAWIVGSLLVVRLAGYRLTWQWRFGRGDSGSETPTSAPMQHDGD